MKEISAPRAEVLVDAPVSVVIPCFKCTRTIGRAFDSIVQQTQKPAEVILVDDASGDETLELLCKFRLEYPDWVKVIALNENQGAASARNAGWNAACQPYVAFLDADDAWHPKKIEIQYNYMATHSEIALSGHMHRKSGSHTKVADWEIRECMAMPISKNSLLLSNRFITPSVMLKREIPFRFAEGKRHMEDHLLWLEIVCAQMAVIKLSADLAAIYKPAYGAAGLSAQLWSMERGDLDNYGQLYQSGCINFIQWLGLCIYSVLKFVRRLILYWGYMRWAK
ncbi:glycosyltransferase family 2 protein [Sideroxydans lithotrophicus]|uniref:Glycosyl transferase family 2 n=1 Tax=Sideroxydans lithotrophicus (strain ES-1) TaxID=580332 RepID=D5CQ90_SIDLE|nr:glycosyltransferase family 2 protein [Sideroxydans lithotrophicus]ADE13111.1 glycosyl transferase family 2 [Sideroxydans lithotrophicus ES-1]